MLEKIDVLNKKGIKLSAVISRPNNKDPLSAVILLHGFTGYKEEEHIVSLSEFLSQRGYVTIRFDASGFGESEGSMWKEYRVSNYMSDVESIYQYLKSLPYVDKSKIHIWGQSMGGMLSVIFASTHPEIKSVCAVSPPVQIAKADALSIHLRKWEEVGFFDKWSSKYGEVKIPFDFVIDARKWDASISVKKVSAPLLVIIGKADKTVSPDDSKKIYETANSPKKLIEIEGMDHDYKKNLVQIIAINELVFKFIKNNNLH